MKNHKEVERLKSLRDSQLKARDPLAKQQKIQRQVSKKNIERAKNRNIVRDIWKEIPHKWKGALFGFILGMLIFFFINLLFSEKINIPFTFLIIPALMIIGLLFGSSFDWRDDLSDF